MSATATDTTEPVAAELSTLDRFLPVWIGLAMATGLLLGRLLPDLDDWLDGIKVGTVSLPIAIGLLAMMYPVLAKVRYRHIGDELADRRTIALSLVLNWLVGPALMFTLAWVFLGDLPELRTGLIIVGLARCIAMVLIWNDLACGSRELGAVLVAVNSVFQIVMYSVLGWFYLTVLPSWLGLDTQSLDVGLWDIARSVLIFLGLPLVAGFLTRTIGEARRGTTWYEQTFLPRIGPLALWGLLFTIVVLFALQGEQITDRPLDVARVAVPLLVYFAVMWFGAFITGYRLGLPYDRNASVAFTAAGNNFELAIAVAIAVFGVTSGQALAGTIGPLIEVPVLVALVYVALWAKSRWYPVAAEAPAAAGAGVTSGHRCRGWRAGRGPGRRCRPGSPARPRRAEPQDRPAPSPRSACPGRRDRHRHSPW
jgi:ACR3 family arsenite transporter